MAKAAKKKSKANKKPARVTAKPKAAAKVAKPAAKKSATRKLDPLNQKTYRSVTPLLSVSNVKRAVDFYTRALGFTVRSVMDSPQGILHAELTLRDTTLMLSPEERRQNNLSANTIGNTPVTLYMMVEDVDKVFGSAVASGGRVLMPVMDMFWGDRCGVIADLDGNKWMIATHKSEPTEAEMAEAMRQMQRSSEAAATASAGGEREF